MDSNRYTFLSLLLASGLAAFCIIIFYIDTHWLIKSVALLLIVIGCVSLWFFKRKEFLSKNTGYQGEWFDIRNQIKNLEQTVKFIFILDTDLTDNKINVSDSIAYIPVNNPEYLNKIALGLMDEYKSKPLFLGLALVCRPAKHSDITPLLKNWLRNILFLQKNIDACVPVNLIIDMPADFLGVNEFSEPVWFAQKLNTGIQESNLPKQFESFQQHLASEFIHNHNILNNQHYIHLIEALDCLKQYFNHQHDIGWSYIDVRSIGLVNRSDATPHSQWHKFISNRTGKLNIQYSNIRKVYPSYTLHLPEKIIGRDSFHQTNWLQKLLFKISSIIVAAICVAVMCSGYNNATFLKGIQAHVDDFKNKENLSESERLKVTDTLYADLNMLKRYQNEGIPTHYGLGLYHGNDLIISLEKMLTPSKPAAPQPPPKKEPVVLTIDSLALFESGQYELKANANKSLIKVIRAIEEQPDTQVIIEGHTDNVGNPAANQKLSEQRAVAVRDWLVISSNIPASRFATKGYGDTKPIADNETEHGKAQNRRVEITLIPNEMINHK